MKKLFNVVKWRMIVAAMLGLLLTACTIVKDDEEKSQKSEGGKEGLEIYFVNDKFDPKTYVNEIWDDQVVPAIQKQAVDLPLILEALAKGLDEAGSAYGFREKGEGTPWNFIAKGEGRILSVNTESRAGTVDVDLEPYDGVSDLMIQIGPIIRGDSIRDSLDFVTFDMFTNQLEFGRLAKAFNAKVYEAVIGSLDLETIQGKVVTFYGTFTPKKGADEIRLIPIQFELGEEE